MSIFWLENIFEFILITPSQKIDILKTVFVVKHFPCQIFRIDQSYSWFLRTYQKITNRRRNQLCWAYLILEYFSVIFTSTIMLVATFCNPHGTSGWSISTGFCTASCTSTTSFGANCTLGIIISTGFTFVSYTGWEMLFSTYVKLLILTTII